jgi:hypothetical protein
LTEGSFATPHNERRLPRRRHGHWKYCFLKFELAGFLHRHGDLSLNSPSPVEDAPSNKRSRGAKVPPAALAVGLAVDRLEVKQWAAKSNDFQAVPERFARTNVCNLP